MHNLSLFMSTTAEGLEKMEVACKNMEATDTSILPERQHFRNVQRSKAFGVLMHAVSDAPAVTISTVPPLLHVHCMCVRACVYVCTNACNERRCIYKVFAEGRPVLCFLYLSHCSGEKCNAKRYQINQTTDF